MKERTYLQDAEETMKKITRGAFLTVQEGNRVNTMTIGWATIGFIWKKEVLMVAVRDSRHTFSLMERSDNFTVTIPADKSAQEALLFCGTKSGRDFDKFSECRLGRKEATHVASPVIDIPGVHYECRIIYKSPMDPSMLDSNFDRLYPQKDYHTLYFGEILACYESE
jgi:flavin reductase (DIM6/NTAB) family NADH-FMN oxidoreductase RutF